MLKFLQHRGRGARILMFFLMGVIGLAMVITMVPGSMDSTVQSADAVAQVGDRTISISEVQTQLRQIAGGQSIPPQLQAIYAEQVIESLVFQQMLDMEAERMGIRVTPQETAERIRLILPSARGGNTDQYRTEVITRTGLTVAAFEDQVRRGLLGEKISRLITDGVTLSPQELEREFRRRNEKIVIEYALLQPDSLLAQINPSDAELPAYFEQNKQKYQVPERRAIRFALLADEAIRSAVQATEDDLRAYYNEHIQRFQLKNRAKVSHILFKTIGKTDAEVEEIRRKAEDVLKQARKPGAKFAELARQHSEDDDPERGTKSKGGDLGWIEPGQTVPDFERAAFTLPVGSVSDLVKTQYGFHIIKVEDREQSRTQPFEEVRDSIRPAVVEQKSRRAAQETEDRLASAIRLDSTKKLEDLAREFHMTLGEAGPAGARELWGALGFSPEVDDAVFRLRTGELSAPLRLENGFAVLELRQSVPAHQATLEEVRGQVLNDYRREKSGEMAKAKAEDLAAKVKGGAALAAAAKSAGLTVKTSEPFARTGSLPDVGSAAPLGAAFSIAPGESGPATSLGANWIVYRVVSRETVKPEEMAAQMRAVEESALQEKRGAAFDAFRDALRERMVSQGLLKYNPENLKRLTGPADQLP
ncbi:MAG: peptidylprolyl isomerase [Candidatus Acidiferrales bacterium]